MNRRIAARRRDTERPGRGRHDLPRRASRGAGDQIGRDTQLGPHDAPRRGRAEREGRRSQRLADRIAGVFVPAVLVLRGRWTLSGWLLAGGSAEQAFKRRPVRPHHRLSLRPRPGDATALLVASGRGATLGIFFKGYSALEASRQVDTVGRDKTGTVTEGRMSVTDVEVAPAVERAALLRWAGGLEEASRACRLPGRSLPLHSRS